MSADSSFPPEAQDVTPSAPSFPTKVRLGITPYLPPPVVQAMKQIDPQLEPFLGPGASINITMTLCLALLVYQVVQWVLGGSTSTTSGAIQNETDDTDQLAQQAQQQEFDQTLLFCGPSGAGKTCLFHSLLRNDNGDTALPKTVASIQPNTGFRREDSTTSTTWRYLDTPGHWGATKLVSTVLEDPQQQQHAIQRIVLVLDATQPVGKAADYLHALLTCPKTDNVKILVACHKSNAPKAKNVRRLKLQLRTELERLETLLKAKHGDAAAPSPRDWEDKLQSRVDFVASSVDPPVLEGLREYVEKGSLSS